MKRKQILFTGIAKAVLKETDIPEMTPTSVKLDTEYTVVSGGTERACILGMPNVQGADFPKALGYCGVGYVTEAGQDVKSVAVGDRCLVYHGVHASVNVVPESDVIKVVHVENEVSSLEAAFVIIAAMGLGGVRKTRIELGESAMVMGLGLLGMFSVQFLRLGGAYPVIAADPNPERRSLALTLGADFAFDPNDDNFAAEVKRVTGGGVKACVEVTGVSKALEQALECAAYMGRISLLGCTRVSDCPIDYYTQVHRPGVELIGAHNFVRPKVDSYPYHWTHRDDCTAILNFIAAKRIEVAPMVSRVVRPEAAPEVYTELCCDPKFPMGTVFSWR